MPAKMKRRRMVKKKILVIDDEKEFTDLIKMSLGARKKYEVRAENKSANALDTVREFKPDLILLDIMMPDDISGDEVARRIRDDEEFKNIPIVFLTAVLTEKEVAERDNVIGGYSFMAKPIKIKELIEHIEKKLA